MFLYFDERMRVIVFSCIFCIQTTISLHMNIWVWQICSNISIHKKVQLRLYLESDTSWIQETMTTKKRPYTYTIIFIRQSFSCVPWMVMKMQFLLAFSQCFWCICRSMILMHHSLTLIIVEYNILCLAWLAHDKTGCVYQKTFTMVWWED